MTKNSMYTHYETDKDCEVNGVWIDFGDFKFRLARAGGSNKRYATVLAAAAKPHTRAIENKTISPEKSQEILRDVFAKTVVIGWEDVKDREGNELTFSYENCVALFTELPDLFADIQEEAAKLANYRLEVLDGIAKN
jgi:hypothetical protein